MSQRRSIYIDDELWGKVESLAKEKDRSASYIVRKALERAFKEKDGSRKRDTGAKR